MAGKMRIVLPDDPKYVHQGLFPDENTRYPEVLRTTEGFRAVLNETSEPALGLDLEFNPSTGRPSILGIANPDRAASVPWDANLMNEVIDVVARRKGTLVGFAVFGADKPVVDGAIGKKTSLDFWDDAMLLHYLTNQALAKTENRDEDEGDSGSLGFFNLWTATSLTTMLPQWKVCRGVHCSGPCPQHDVFGYNGIDALAGLRAFLELKKRAKKLGISWEVYRNLCELAYVCQLMEDRGVRVDFDYVHKLDAEADEKKLSLFPYTLHKGKPVYTKFNPKAPAQVTKYFADKNVVLKKTDKKEILKVLEKRLAANGVSSYKEYQNNPADLDELTRDLADLYEYKSSGKGLKAWFDEKYIGKDRRVHPRFICTGTQTTRLSSSRPNFQNVPARGFGALVRGAIRPDEGYTLVKSDISQLELRNCLYLAGFDLKEIGRDAFKWLVENSSGAFDRAAEIASSTPRDVAKRLAHAFNYLEGFVLLSYADLSKPGFLNEYNAGALSIYHPKFKPGLKKPWEFYGKVVAFTGANLAESLFGDRSLESRKKALQIQEDIYAKQFPIIRKWQQDELAKIEATGRAQLTTGNTLELIGKPEDVAKAGIAAKGQGTGAQHVQGLMLKLFRETGEYPLLQVHDELVMQLPGDWPHKKIVDFMSFMGQPCGRTGLEGFLAPAKVYAGKSWLPEEEEKRPYAPEFKEIALVEIGKV